MNQSDGEGNMTKLSEEKILELIHHLRKKSGIKPIPYSDAELNSGVVSSFASALGSQESSSTKPEPSVLAQPRQLQKKPSPPPAENTHPAQEPDVPDSIGQKPLNHRRSFSLKC